MTDRTAIALARMIVSDAIGDIYFPRHRRWEASNDTVKPKKPKDRSKVKAARKQRTRK